MAFIRLRGKTKLMYFEGDTAEEVRDGSLVMMTDSGTVVPARNDSTDAILGVARRNDTTTDSALIPVEVPVESAVEWLIDVDSDAGAADSDVGRFVAVDTAGGTTGGDSVAISVDVSDSAHNSVFITQIVSASKVIGVLANTAWHQTYDT